MTQGERIKLLRKTINLTMESFGQRIGLRKNSVSQIENGINGLTDQTAKSICREFNVNEDWLLNGTGEMFIPDTGDELEALAKKYGYSAAVGVLIEKLINLPPESQAVVTDFLVEFASGIQSMKDAGADLKGKAFPQGEAPEMTIDERVEIYRRALEAEEEAKKRATQKSEVS